MRRAPLIVLTLAWLPGCVTIRTIDDGIERARFGETVRTGPLTVAPERLIEDSRCPDKVQCIRAGTVRIVARIEGREVELELDRPVNAAGGALTLAEVYPPARTGRLYPDEYRFGFRWQHPRSR
ncbi:MAG TPA: hypothetical protein VI199_00735 [Novosphingobium sp.]